MDRGDGRKKREEKEKMQVRLTCYLVETRISRIEISSSTTTSKTAPTTALTTISTTTSTTEDRVGAMNSP